MNKSKMVVAVIGGAMGIVALALAFFTWCAYSAKTAATEGDDDTVGLDSVVAKAKTLSESPIYPCAESETLLKSNATLVADWLVEAKRAASVGDKIFEPTTPAAFKAFLTADAKRLATLPGGVAEGRLAKEDFAFGPFREYIVEGKMPADDQLALLQRKWDDIATVTELLSTNGVAELVDVQFADAAAAAPKADEKATQRKNRKNKKKSKDEERPAAARGLTSQGYVVTFSAKPSALVRVVNALETCERFVAVEDVSFTRADDEIASKLGGDEKKPEQLVASSRRGRRHGGEKAVEEQAKAEVKIQEVPLGTGAPLTVVLKIRVYDFGSLAEGEKENRKEVEK